MGAKWHTPNAHMHASIVSRKVSAAFEIAYVFLIVDTKDALFYDILFFMFLLLVFMDFSLSLSF